MEGGGSMTARRAVQQILLCGFMGCGKTSVGQALAFRLRWDFLDTDALIEKRTGMSIPEIFATQGDTCFRQMEQQAAAMLGSAGTPSSPPGGGFLTRKQTVQALRQNGGFEAVVFLDCSFETCYQRIKDSDRPLVRANSREGLEQIFLQRQQRYREVADLIVPNESLVSLTVEQILRELPIL